MLFMDLQYSCLTNNFDKDINRSKKKRTYQEYLYKTIKYSHKTSLKRNGVIAVLKLLLEWSNIIRCLIFWLMSPLVCSITRNIWSDNVLSPLQDTLKLTAFWYALIALTTVAKIVKNKISINEMYKGIAYEADERDAREKATFIPHGDGDFPSSIIKIIRSSLIRGVFLFWR